MFLHLKDNEAPLKALIFDSYYDAYKGVVAMLEYLKELLKRVVIIKMMNTNKSLR